MAQPVKWPKIPLESEWVHNMFNQTYKQISGYISRKDINEILKFSYSNFFTKFGVFILAMGFVFGLYVVGTGPAQGDWGETGNRVASILINIVGPLVKISDGIFFLMLLAWVVISYYNRGIAAVQGSLIGLVWCLTTFFFTLFFVYDSTCNSTRLDFLFYSTCHCAYVFLCIYLYVDYESTH